jgi:hypothetical protein
MPKTTDTPVRKEVEVDTRIAAAHAVYLEKAQRLMRELSSLHYLIPRPMRYDRYSNDGYIVLDGKRTYATIELLTQLFEAGTIGSPIDSYAHKGDVTKFDAYTTAAGEAKSARAAYDEVSKEYEGWSRFFLVPAGHIHSSMNCSTCNKNGKATEFSWLPDLSGLTEADAVAAHGAFLCTVCFPSAPVEFTNGAELAEAAKHANRCEGSGRYCNAARSRAKCEVCGTYVRLSSNSRFFTHDTPTKTD